MHVTLYTRSGCHLCEDMKAVLRQVRRQRVFELTEVDISRDPELQRRYQHDIPVLLVDDTEVARHRIDEVELLRKLGRV